MLRAGEAQENVDILCQRFSALFAQLHREEGAIRVAAAYNEQLARRLAELRKEEHCQNDERWVLQVDGRLGSEAAELRRETQQAEQRAAAVGGEAGAFTAAAETYARQAARLRQRCEDEASRERGAGEALRRSAERLRDIRRQRGELSTELQDAEAGRMRIHQEFQKASDDIQQNSQEASMLSHWIREEKARGETMAQEAQGECSELATLEQQLNQKRADLEAHVQQLEAQRAETREAEDMLSEQMEARDRVEEGLRELSRDLEGRQREGEQLRTSIREQTSEAEKEERAAYGMAARLGQMKLELAAAERSREDAEAGLELLRRHTEELEEKCATQRAWQDELHRKRSSSEAALEKLREELRGLATERARLQKEAEEVARDRAKLEVELQVATPSLKEVTKRCHGLEERLATRVRQLGIEGDKFRQSLAEASSAHMELQALEQRTEMLGARLRECKEPQAVCVEWPSCDALEAVGPNLERRSPAAQQVVSLKYPLGPGGPTPSTPLAQTRSRCSIELSCRDEVSGLGRGEAPAQWPACSSPDLRQAQALGCDTATPSGRSTQWHACCAAEARLEQDLGARGVRWASAVPEAPARGGTERLRASPGARRERSTGGYPPAEPGPGRSHGALRDGPRFSPERGRRLDESVVQVEAPAPSGATHSQYAITSRSVASAEIRSAHREHRSPSPSAPPLPVGPSVVAQARRRLLDSDDLRMSIADTGLPFAVGDHGCEQPCRLPDTFGCATSCGASEQQNNDDAVRFLCEFVAREEERLGLVSRRQLSRELTAEPH